MADSTPINPEAKAEVKLSPAQEQAVREVICARDKRWPKLIESQRQTWLKAANHNEAWSLCMEVARKVVEEERERAAGIAMGSTGPGNTIDQCSGYTAACKDIAVAIRAAR